MCQSQTGDDANGFQRSICSPSFPQTDHWDEMGPSCSIQAGGRDKSSIGDNKVCQSCYSGKANGQWMTWQGVVKRKISWKELWEMETFRASLTIKAAYDVLPSPKNLNQWYGEYLICPLCLTSAHLGGL